MTVKQLKAKLDKHPDNTIVLLDGGCGSYYHITSVKKTTLEHLDDDYYKYDPDDFEGKKVTALVISDND